MERYLGVDAHAESCTICVLSESGRRIHLDVVETRGPALVGYFRQQPGRLHVLVEETEWSEWLVELLSPYVADILSVPGKPAQGSKSDQIDAYRLAERRRTGDFERTVYKAPRKFAKLRELARVYRMQTADVVRTKNRLRSLFRRRGVSAPGTAIYDPKKREPLVHELPEAMWLAAELLGRELERLDLSKAETAAAMIEEAHRSPISRILETAPGLGPIRVAQLLPIVIDPRRFRTKRQFWSYSGFGIVTHTSGDWVQVDGQWVKAPVTRTRGLNHRCNRVLKTIFKGAATTVLAQRSNSLLRSKYERLLDNGTKPNLAKLTIARTIAAITLAMWKSQRRYDPERIAT